MCYNGSLGLVGIVNDWNGRSQPNESALVADSSDGKVVSVSVSVSRLIWPRSLCPWLSLGPLTEALVKVGAEGEGGLCKKRR